MYLDTVERRKLAEIKGTHPEYANLELHQIAHCELKNRLFELVRQKTENIKSNKQIHQTMPLLSNGIDYPSKLAIA